MAAPERDILSARLRTYPVDRYPVQHATNQFHLGSVLLRDGGDPGAALAALTIARDVFEQVGMTLERSKAAVMLGVALHGVRRLENAAEELDRAARDLDTLDQPVELAAACYNLGLVRHAAGELEGARAAWRRARELFETTGHLARAAAAARDHGASLLATGEVDAALGVLEQALGLAERAGDVAGVGSAANALGLARLAGDEPAAAVSDLQLAVDAFPAATRPSEHAMAKANMALAHERAGDAARARLAAAQALAVANAAAPVRGQAQALLARLGTAGPADLWSVLDDEARDGWTGVIRLEARRWLQLPERARTAAVRGFLDGVLTRAGTSYDLVHSLLEVVVEQPPPAYERLVRALRDASADRPQAESDRLRAVVASAMARFAVPQWQRLAASLQAAERAGGGSATWA